MIVIGRDTIAVRYFLTVSLVSGRAANGARPEARFFRQLRFRFHLMSCAALWSCLQVQGERLHGRAGRAGTSKRDSCRAAFRMERERRAARNHEAIGGTSRQRRLRLERRHPLFGRTRMDGHRQRNSRLDPRPSRRLSKDFPNLSGGRHRQCWVASSSPFDALALNADRLSHGVLNLAPANPDGLGSYQH